MKLTKYERQQLENVYKYTTANINEINVAENVSRLISIGKSLRKSYEYSCNYRQTEEQSLRREKREERLENEAKEIGNSLGFIVYIQTDCRGNSIYLLPNSKITIANEAIEKGRYTDVFSWVDCNYSGHAAAWF